MNFTNSPLITCKRISAHKNSPRNHSIDTITIHCFVGQITAERGVEFFAETPRDCSCNYVVGCDGGIGLCVDEKDRSWCSSSRENDNRAVTIEVASDIAHPYTVTDAAYNSLIKLVADICKRNGIKKLLWRADKNLIGEIDKQNMTVHRWFANKLCPGDYLYNKHYEIAERVNKLLGQSFDISSGDIVSISGDATYYSGEEIPQWVKNKKWVVKTITGERAVIDNSADGQNSINSPINVCYLIKEKPTETTTLTIDVEKSKYSSVIINLV